TLYSDGVRNGSGVAQNGTTKGFGLRNPDNDGNSTSAADTTLKPQMTVIFHGANDMLHAFRAGPNCNNTTPSACAEQGAEELWAFVPYDLLAKLKDRMRTQVRDPHTYMLAAPVRIVDVFVPGSYSTTVGSQTVASTNGVWRTVVLFGR